MKLTSLNCPNCGSSLRTEGGAKVCDSCGSTFAIDYDESDVEFEKIQTEAEREQLRLQHEKEILEKQYELQERANLEAEKRARKRMREQSAARAVKSLISWIVTLGVLALIVFGVFKLKEYVQNGGDLGYFAGIDKVVATPTPAPNYDVTPEDVEPQMEDFIASGKKVQMGIDQCAYWDTQSAVDFYKKKDAELVDAYIVTNIPEKDPDESNRLVLIFKVIWNNEDEGDKECYDAVYFEGIRVNPNGGGVISDFNGRTIDRSDAAWGWSMAYSFEEYDQCYRENITALGGKVTQVKSK